MNIQDLNFLTMVRLDVSVWSGRAKLRKEDLSEDIQGELPPEDMATLGSKRLYDPGHLKIFNTLKARAAGVLDKKAVRFLGGWATHEERLPELAQELENIAQEFYDARDNFLRDYSTSVVAWANNFPQYRDALLNSVPGVFEVERKFGFNWQMFKIAPTDFGDRAYTGNNLGDTLNGIEVTLLEEIARGISDTYKECFDNKETVTKKAFRPVRTLIDKVRGLTFLHPNIASLEAILTEAVAIVEDHANDPQHVAMFKNFMLSMQSAEAISIVCEQAQQVGAAAVFDPFWATGVVQTPKPADQCDEMCQVNGMIPPPAPVPAEAPKVPTPPPGWGSLLKNMIPQTPDGIVTGPMTGEQLADMIGPPHHIQATAETVLMPEDVERAITPEVKKVITTALSAAASAYGQTDLITEAQQIVDAIDGVTRDVDGTPLIGEYAPQPVLDDNGDPLPGVLPDGGLW